VTTPRVLFVARTRYELPLPAPVARKWEALAEQMELRVLATAAREPSSDGRFTLLEDRPLAAFYAVLPMHVAREVSAFEPDVVVVQSPYEAAAAKAGLALARSRARILLEVHGDWETATMLYGSPARRALEPVSRRIARAAVRSADAVRTVSPFTSDLVRAAGGEPTATFTTYFDVGAFTGPLAPLPEAPSALFVGVLERYKNVAGLAAAWRLASPRLPGATLSLVGAGRETVLVQELVDELPHSTKWTPRLAPAEVAAALDTASLLVLPSFSEGLPRVAIEAFARGRPVVGARAGGIPDIVEDGVNGLLVDPHDPESIAEGLVRALGDRALLERLAAGAAASSSRWLQSPELFALRMRALVDGLR
jgi:glycosyltransferase involved in cell wall biosynthesis